MSSYVPAALCIPMVLGIFGGNFLTYDLLTIASFRVGVPSILFFMETSEVQDPLKVQYS